MSLRDSAKSIQDVADVLQVSIRADREVLDAAKKALMAKYHPDKNGGCDEKMKDVADAHRILTDRTERAKFEKMAKKGTIIGNYRVVEKIAEGGFGATYKAEHVVLNQPACLKQGFMSGQESEDILLDEARALWDMRHYAIPAMRDVIRHDDGSIVLVMSYVEGPTLEEVVEKAGRLDPENTAWIINRLLNGLLYLHQNGVVHGDLKPKNIIVQPAKHLAVLVDFGLAAIRPTGKTAAKGYTDLFSAPEMINGKPPIPETDLYSLGKTMLYCLTGTYDGVKSLNVPVSTPDAMCSFLKKLIVLDPLSRPNWTKENLIETFANMRVASFGRSSSNLKPIPGFSS
jgi:serine/threonine protein kinase